MALRGARALAADMNTPRTRFQRSSIACVAVLALATVTHADDNESKDQKNPKRPALVLKATPAFAFSPARVVVKAELRGGSDSDAELYCPDVEWEWGDGTRSEASQNCDPFVPNESKINRRWTVSHTYTTAGRYQVYLRLKRGGKDVLAGTVRIEVKPGARDLGEFDQ